MNTRTAIALLTTALAAAALTGCSGSDTEELSYGEKATKDNLEVSVLRVEAGTSGDLSVLEDAAEYQGRTPYYVRYRVTKTEAGKVDGPSFDVTADGGLLTQLNIMASFPVIEVGADGKPRYKEAPKFEKCIDEPAAAEFGKAPAGASYEGCTIYLSDTGSTAEPKKVEWNKGGLVRSSEDEAYAVWK